MRILVADDHELFLKGLEFILSDVSKDLQLVFAKSYTDIFKILETDRGFNLVLTDLAMPGANWEEAITRIHSTLPETPIIILSAVFDKGNCRKNHRNRRVRIYSENFFKCRYSFGGQSGHVRRCLYSARAP